MRSNDMVENLLVDIEECREKLNKMAFDAHLQSPDIISCSQHLDRLIHKYLSIVHTPTS
ncbi:aspartyl-phosphate phosphatase Spo0E family protein [Alkalihalobacillus trypoxylicola]|uniref:aspartyl-phosphate phosphatase Spo0E family protein n=1 Tax=Alkalihalobacillus trypoxylicola TaxID=519424 RepID=UPI00043656F2|nr:aspartyl-phosphate phosphatase Spo0E family protein [Alkalihalobacillus trypoxylicola]GAF65211.1 hypothetical protein BTS2_2109 [Bacillus sp. TS-2]